MSPFGGLFTQTTPISRIFLDTNPQKEIERERKRSRERNVSLFVALYVTEKAKTQTKKAKKINKKKEKRKAKWLIHCSGLWPACACSAPYIFFKIFFSGILFLFYFSNFILFLKKGKQKARHFSFGFSLFSL